jgi:hypothetical protein
VKIKSNTSITRPDLTHHFASHQIGMVVLSSGDTIKQPPQELLARLMVSMSLKKLIVCKRGKLGHHAILPIDKRTIAVKSQYLEVSKFYNTSLVNVRYLPTSDQTGA